MNDSAKKESPHLKDAMVNPDATHGNLINAVVLETVEIESGLQRMEEEEKNDHNNNNKINVWVEQQQQDKKRKDNNNNI